MASILFRIAVPAYHSYVTGARTFEEELGNAFLNMLGESAATYTIGDHYTDIIEAV